MSAVSDEQQGVNNDPTLQVEVQGNNITLLGTAHVSRHSAEQVEFLLRSGEFNCVAVELCEARHFALSNPDSLAEMDLMQVIREGKASMIAANLAMGAFQQRLADQFGIEPGAEMRAALNTAQELDIPVVLIDRDIGTTLKRTAHSLSWWRRWALFSGLIAGLVSKDDVTEDEVESLKQGDMLESTFAEFAQDREDLYRPLIAERDTYMATRLMETHQAGDDKKTLAVIGAGHLKGIGEQLEVIDEPESTRVQLETLPVKSRWPKLIPWAIALLIVSGFVIGFMRSPDLGWQLVMEWVIINGSLSALGALIATAHIGTVITAFVAAPLTSLNPTIGAGMVTAAAELWLRKPHVSDFSELRRATSSFTGWFKNRVSRTLLVFLFSTLGSAIGTYLAGFRIFDLLTNGQ